MTATGHGPSALAQTGGAPVPIVVAIDPGHGGVPNPNNPAQPFDPGAIGPNGLEEKDVALDVAKRLADLLRADLVVPVLTRTTDIGMTVEAREQVAIDAHAAVFISIHCNSYTDPIAGGSLVLYPNAMGEPFAQALSDALGKGLATDAVADDGIVLRDNWWIHAPMPTATAEIAFISNPREAALLATEPFRQLAAAALRAGIEAFDPHIAQRKAAILAWEREHPDSPPPTATEPPHGVAAVRTTAAGGVPGFVPWLLLAAVLAAALYFRREIAPLAIGAAQVLPLNRRALHRALARRRRRALRAHSLVHRNDPARRHSVYDDLSF
ncbi:MAG: N-acetylmuramoyl-L-alanine amidase [Candidatus Dormibacteraeota bacterium]|nr:N-acetylmuramoyl-L-alanine amidase [Candidatus Dormibacteraeota bacterium]